LSERSWQSVASNLSHSVSQKILVGSYSQSHWLDQRMSLCSKTGCCHTPMRNLGHEKKLQHAFIKRVILHESFLSATWSIISARAIGMCPCGYLTAWHTLRLWEKRSRREANIVTGKNERSQRKWVNFKVGLSVFRVTSFWLCRLPATEGGFGRTTCHHTPGNEKKKQKQKKNRIREVFSLVTPFVMMWCNMCLSFQFYGVFSLLDRHHSPLHAIAILVDFPGQAVISEL